MAGNKSIYDTAMKRAHEYAWANQWERAMKEYGRALGEFPGDRTAQRNLAQCMFRLRQWPQALAAYQDLLHQDPADAFALNRLAEIYLAIGQQDQAHTAYNQLADLYIQNNQVHEAIRALRDFSRAMPKNKEVHNRLLDVLQEVGDAQGQAAEHMALSQIALEAGLLGEAQQNADVASALDPENPEVRKWAYAVRRRLAESAGTVALSGDPEEIRRGASMPGTHMLPSMDEPPVVTALVDQAMAASEMGEYGRALDFYDQAVRAGAKRPAVFYSAGVLNQQMGRPEQAVALLERALQDSEFAMSANYMLGTCYLALRNPPKAVAAFERALALVDLDKLSRAEADELIELYKSAAEAHMADNNPGRAASLFSNLAATFKSRKWAHPQLGEIEKKADELYNKSIQSKLQGISRGSTMLDPDRVPSGPIDGTNMIGVDGEQGTSQLPSGSVGTAKIGEAPERPTSMIGQPGSNLRSITEYLRAAEIGGNRDSSDELDGTRTLRPGTGTEQLVPSNLNAAGHVMTNLPTSMLLDKQGQDFAVQVLLAEGEHAMSDGKWDVAIDCCFTVIGVAPDYLPIHMMLGDIYLHQGKTEEAITKYQTVMDTYMARQESGQAADVCERLLQLQPDNPALQTRHGVLLMAAGRVDDAARALLVAAERYHLAGDTPRALEEALSLKSQLPASSDVALSVGTYQLLLGNLPEAVGELSRALHLNPGNDMALIRLYTCLVRMDDPAQWDALQSLLERSSKNPAQTRLFMEELHRSIQQYELPGLYYALAVLAGRSGLDDIAADSLDQGILFISMSDEAPESGSWRLLDTLMAQYRADMAINSKEWGLAIRHYSRALELLQPGAEGKVALELPRPQYDFTRLADPVQLYYGLAEAYASQNNWDGALQSMKTLKTLMPEDHGVHTRLADIYFRKGNLTEALGELNDLLVEYQKQNENEKTLETLGHMARLAPNNVAVRRKLSDMYLKLGMTDYGLTELNTLAELQLKASLLKDAMRTYQKAADLHYTMGQHDKATGIYERIVRIAPRDLTARDQLINMYIQMGKIKEAIASERALADLFIQEGRTEEAIAALHQLLALSPEDVQGHYLLAKQLTSLGEYGQAARLYGRLLRLDPDNDQLPNLHTEMQRMAQEVEEEKKAAKKEGGKASKTAKQAATA